ncbi:hypothetical protein AB0G29_33755 [Streptomyces parvus]|uniref:hypothetical protein n=1 Tax=Streptomyces parvus TaxID=66428 RepID=UPI0033D00CE7
MIVLGSLALEPVMDFVLGSVSMTVIGATNCPIVSVRAKRRLGRRPGSGRRRT